MKKNSPEFQYGKRMNNNSNEFKSVLENASDVVLIIQNNNIVFINSKPLEEYGYSITDVTYKNIMDFIFVDDKEKITEFQIRKFKDEGFPDDLVLRIFTKQHRLLFIKTISISTLWQDKPARLVCVKNITNRKINDLTLKNSGNLLFNIINNFSDPTFVLDINKKVYLWNKALEELTGIKSESIIGKGNYKEMLPFVNYKEPDIADLSSKSNEEIEKDYEFFHREEDILIAGRFVYSSNDKKNHVLVTSSILYDIQGNIIGAVESFKDMTDLKNYCNELEHAVKEKKMLIKEIHHRVKNNMQLISSMLSIQLRYVKNPEAEELFKDSVSRISTMAMIHTELYKYTEFADINFQNFIPKIIQNLCVLYNKQDISVEITAEEVHLGIDDAIPCGLVINELLANCYKHAFIDNPKGIITIKLFFQKQTGICSLTIKDNGCGLPADFDYNNNTTSFGLLMVNLLLTQLNGDMKITSESGTEIEITFPVKIANNE